MSKVVDEKHVVVGTDIGVIQVKLKTVSGYGVEDIIRNRALSFARHLQFILLGKQVSNSVEIPERAVKTIYANNEIEVD